MYVNFLNVLIALKAVLFEGKSGTNVKNVEKISRGVPKKDKLQAFVLYASGFMALMTGGEQIP
ncbi:hypothetical protein [Holospora undulata]|uniref:hypothetical protein n=1 Tax=Holospora undulata TaxID=1169117 RepID=UPI000330F4DF|nr:hypothetical protein [Holospora undulata]